MAEDASLDTMSAREIKERLAAARVDFSDCFEKSELVKRLRQHREAEAAERVQEVKALANSAFSRGGYALAIRFYTEALDLCAHDDIAAQLQSNRAISLLKLDQVASARRDAEECVMRRPGFARGYLRLATAAARQGDNSCAVRACLAGRAALAESAGGAVPRPPPSSAASEEGTAAPPPPQFSGDQKLLQEFDSLLEAQLAILGCSVESFPPAGLSGHGHVTSVKQLAGDRDAREPAEGDFLVPVGSKLMEELSEDVIAELLGQYLSPSDICKAAQTCRMLRSICVFGDKSTKIWQAVCERCWPRASTAQKNSSKASRNWRMVCLERSYLDVRWQQGLTQSRVSIIKADQGPVFNIVMQGTTVASAEDSSVRVWDLAHKKCTKNFNCHPSGHRMVLGLWMDEEGSTCLSGGADGDVKVWDMNKNVCRRVLAGHQGPVVSLKADQDKIVSTSFDGTARVWTWEGRERMVLEGHSGHVCGLWLQPASEGGNSVWTGADDGLVKKWDINTGACQFEFVHSSLPGTVRMEPSGSVWCVQASRSSVVTGATDGSVRVWDIASGREQHSLMGHEDAVAGLQFDDRTIVTSGFDGTLRVWDWRTMRCRGVVRLVEASHREFRSLSTHSRRCTRLSMDEHKVVVGCIDGTIYCVDVY